MGWDSDRLWRKTRGLTGLDRCKGIDGNRNFDSAWDAGFSSTFGCSDTYRGVAPNSEPEIAGLTDYVMSLRESIVYFRTSTRSQSWCCTRTAPPPGPQPTLL